VLPIHKEQGDVTVVSYLNNSYNTAIKEREQNKVVCLRTLYKAFRGRVAQEFINAFLSKLWGDELGEDTTNKLVYLLLLAGSHVPVTELHKILHSWNVGFPF
jgi:hypothetical protein